MSEDPPPDAITPEEARHQFGRRFEAFIEAVARAAKEQEILGYACIVITDKGISVVSGGDPDEEWRATMRRIAGRIADELGQVLIARGVGRKPGHG
jgi:hypothetical protein